MPLSVAGTDVNGRRSHQRNARRPDRNRLARLRRLRVVSAVAACLVLGTSGCGEASHFVRRSGERLTLNGKDWRFVGFNDYQLTSVPGSTVCGEAIDRATLNWILANARNDGATVIRTWFFQSYYDMTNASGRWLRINSTWTAFDRVLDAAAAHHLKVIPVLMNEYPTCEPTQTNMDLSFYKSGYAQPGGGYPLSFRAYATTVARHYANNSTVAFWQLGNELENVDPRGCNEPASAKALRAFADGMTAAIKSADPNHLVSLGTIGTNQCGLAGADYRYVHAGAVDMCEYHDYGAASRSIPQDGANGLARTISQCRALNKPVFIGEAGIRADVGDDGRSTGKITGGSLNLRAGFFDAKMTAAFRSGVVGYLIWDKRQFASWSLQNYDGGGGYEIGPVDPANAVTASIARTFGAVPGITRAGFEDGGSDAWAVAPGSHGVTVGNSTFEAWGGKRSLAIALDGVSTASVQTHATSGAGGGSTFTYHVYVPSTAPEGLLIQPYVTGPSGQQVLAAETALTTGWNLIQFTAPTLVSGPLRAIGVLIDNPRNWRGVLFLDDVSW